MSGAVARPIHPADCTSAVKIMLDVGHTPEQPGATSARGLPEFDFNLNLARRIAQELEAQGYAVNLPIVHGIGQGQLAARVANAKSYSPSLFISIHHDSVQQMFLHQWTFSGRVSHYSDEFSGFSIFVSRLSAKLSETLAFAQTLADELIKRGLRPSPHHAMKVPGEARTLLDPQRGIYENNQLAVLREVPYPAVLLEAGIIVNRSEEVSLQADNIKAEISQAIARAVTKTFCTRPISSSD